jgi:hypothetical protein
MQVLAVARRRPLAVVRWALAASKNSKRKMNNINFKFLISEVLVRNSYGFGYILGDYFTNSSVYTDTTIVVVFHSWHKIKSHVCPTHCS